MPLYFVFLPNREYDQNGNEVHLFEKNEKLGKSLDKLEAKFGRNIVKTGFNEWIKNGMKEFHLNQKQLMNLIH